jgi:hypothetical protein
MASNMWANLLGGDKPYPVRVGNYCFSQETSGGNVVAHLIDEKSLKENACCRECNHLPDLRGVKIADLADVLQKVKDAIAGVTGGAVVLKPNPKGIDADVLKYFQDISDLPQTDLLTWAGNLQKYLSVFAPTGPVQTAAQSLYDKVHKAKTAAAAAAVTTPPTGAVNVWFSGGDDIAAKALKTELDAVFTAAAPIVQKLVPANILYDAAQTRKTLYLDVDGVTVKPAGAKVTIKTGGSTVLSASSCTDGQARMKDLQTKLIVQLNTLEKEASSSEADALCGLACSEDVEMDRMMRQYEEVLEKAKAQSQPGAPTAACELTKFDADETIALLKQKKKLLKKQSFAFLHAECEAVELCDPYDAQHVPKKLVACSGLHDSEMLFNDTSMAAIGQYLAGPQRDGQSPGALGHASRLYPTGTIAPGVNPDELWINVCYRVAGTKDNQEGSVDTMWVRANVCDQRKYETLRAIDKAITEQKRAILALNREILDLQFEVSSAQGLVHSPAAFFSTARRDNGALDESFMRTEMAIKNSVARAASTLRRNSDRRRRPSITQIGRADDAVDAADGHADPRFSRMMRTLARSVRGRVQ